MRVGPSRSAFRSRSQTTSKLLRSKAVVVSTLAPSRMINRPPIKICRALSDGQIQPFDKRCIQFWGVLRVAQSFLQSPVIADYCSPLDLHNAIISSGFNDLTVPTRGSLNTVDGLGVISKSVRGNKRDMFQIRSSGDISKKTKGVSIAPPPNHCRRPKTRPDLDRGKNPDGLFLVVDDSANLICLKLWDGDPIYRLIIEAATRGSCLLQPMSYRVPRDSLNPRDCGLIHTLNT